VAAVGKEEAIMILDPAKARRGREVRVDKDAEIANLLRWLDTRL
jgi:hypothetical protein